MRISDWSSDVCSSDLRLKSRRRKGGIVGVNIGANKDSANRIADYAAGVTAMMGVADYLTVNISSPNTPGLRALQAKAALDELLAAATEARGAGPPVFPQVSPALASPEIAAIFEVSMARRSAAPNVSTTTPS